jgi:hypothetical protein
MPSMKNGVFIACLPLVGSLFSMMALEIITSDKALVNPDRVGMEV